MQEFINKLNEVDWTLLISNLTVIIVNIVLGIRAVKTATANIKLKIEMNNTLSKIEKEYKDLKNTVADSNSDVKDIKNCTDILTNSLQAIVKENSTTVVETIKNLETAKNETITSSEKIIKEILGE